jgi:hypothetical protein
MQEMLRIDIVPSNQSFMSEHIGYSSVIFLKLPQLLLDHKLLR